MGGTSIWGNVFGELSLGKMMQYLHCQSFKDIKIWENIKTNFSSKFRKKNAQTVILFINYLGRRFKYPYKRLRLSMTCRGPFFRIFIKAYVGVDIINNFQRSVAKIKHSYIGYWKSCDYFLPIRTLYSVICLDIDSQVC